MPDVLNVSFASATSNNTTMRVTAYSFTPRTDATGTVCSLTVAIQMGPTSWVGTHSSDPTYGRVLIGTVNGHDIGAHTIKPYNTVAWNQGGLYTYTINFNIPYSPGTVAIQLSIRRQTSGTDGTACFTMPGGYTANSGAGAVPSAVQNLKLNGVTGATTIAHLTGNLTLSFDAPLNPGTGSVQGYYIYYHNQTRNPGQWAFWHSTTSTAVTVNAALDIFRINRGNVVEFNVIAYNAYGHGPMITTYPRFALANAPSAPTSVSSPAESKYNTSLRVGWSGAGAGSGSVLQYHVQVRRLSSGSWSDWANIGYTNMGYIDTTPSTYTAWAVRPGDVLQYRVATINTYGLWSGYREGGTSVMKGGIIRVNVGGAWKEGTAWVNVGGVWKEASSVYINVGGAWKESL